MANENMIQKHVDNFLAKIAGETPIDDNPRNSTEFWLNEIAENLPSGGGGSFYVHRILMTATVSSYTAIVRFVLITTDSTPYTSSTITSANITTYPATGVYRTSPQSWIVSVTLTSNEQSIYYSNANADAQQNIVSITYFDDTVTTITPA